MSAKMTFAAIAALLCLPAAAPAQDPSIMIRDAYARSSSPVAKAGAAFMEIENLSGRDDRLVSVASTAAHVAQLHAHRETGEGVMQMLHVEAGFDLPAGETLHLKRGGRHVMLMGLTDPLEQGETITITLTFETAGDISVDVPVDLTRKPAMAHGAHSN